MIAFLLPFVACFVLVSIFSAFSVFWWCFPPPPFFFDGANFYNNLDQAKRSLKLENVYAHEPIKMGARDP